MKKRMLVLLGLLLLLLAACGKQTQEPGQTGDGGCGIPWEQVETITITRSTEGGTECASLTQQEDI